MKKFLIIVASTFSVSLSQAQLYVQGGLNLANITSTNDGQTESNAILPTVQAGLTYRLGISKVFDVETGLLLTGKGSKAETFFNNNADYVKSSFNPFYLELPLNLVFKIPLGNQGRSNLFFHVGPYVAMGIGGTSTLKIKVGGLETTTKSDIQFSNDDPFTSQQDDAAYNKLKRFDFGGNVGAGFDFHKIVLKVNLGVGFAKIGSTQQNNSSNDNNKYRVLSVTIGIPLTGRK